MLHGTEVIPRLFLLMVSGDRWALLVDGAILGSPMTCLSMARVLLILYDWVIDRDARLLLTN